VNADPLRAHALIVQGGAFGEHCFTTATDVDGGNTVEVAGPWLRVELGPAAALRLRLGTRRFAAAPAYGGPRPGRATPAPLRGRTTRP